MLDVLTASTRLPWAEVKAAPHGVLATDAPEPGWLIPHNLPRLLDLAPAPVVEQFATWAGSLPGVDELVLVNRRLVRQMNSTMRDVGAQAALAPYPTLLVHPDDAASRDIHDGDEVEIESAHGRTTARAEASEAIRRAVVSVPHGLDATAAPTGMPRYSGFPVRVRPLVTTA